MTPNERAPCGLSLRRLLEYRYRSMAGVRIGVQWGLAIALIALPGRAETNKERCKASYEDGQRSKRDGDFAAAREALRTCTTTCPAVLARDCDDWLRELEASKPTVRLSLRDSQGRPITDARVFVDDRWIAAVVPAEPIALDPGPHVFRFEKRGMGSTEVTATLKPSEEEHPIAALLESPPPPVVRAEDAAPPAPSHTPSFILGAAGLAALGAAGTLAIVGHVQRADLRDTCAPKCDPSDVTTIRTLWWTSAALAGAGIVSFSLAALFWRSEPAPRHDVAIVPFPGGILLRGELP